MELGDVVRKFRGRQFVKGDNVTEFYSKIVPLENQRNLSIVFLFVLSLSCFTGLVGNTMVIAAVIVSKKLRTMGNMFIVNLAIADLIVVTIVEPFNMVGVILGPSFFLDNFWVCHTVSIVCVMACVCSMMNLAAIAINRYILITKSYLYTEIYTKRRTLMLCLLVWIIAFLIELPNLVGWGDHTFDLKTLGCSFDRLVSLSYTIFLGALALWIPLIVILFCYISIYLRVVKIKQQLLRISLCSKKDKKRSRRLTEDANLARTFFIVFMTFLICWAPYDFLILIDQGDVWPQWVYILFLQIGHFNSSLNSILYGLTNRRFRDGYASLFKKIFHLKKTLKVSGDNKREQKENANVDPERSTDGNLSSGFL